MRLTVNKISFLFLILFCLFSFACGQTEAEKIKLHNEYVDKATVLRKQGDLQGAIEQQKKAVEIFPNNADTLAVLAGIYLDLYEKDSSKSNLENSKHLLERASKINPKNVVIREMYSTILELLGDKQGALREMKAAVELQPDNLDNRVNLAVIQKSLGKNESARENFEYVLQRNPNYIYALYHYGEAELEDGNIEKAKELFSKVVDLDETAESRDLNFVRDSKKRLVELESKKAKVAKP